MPPSEFENSLWGKFLKWGVNAGRYILIVTEMVVIVAFLSEFKLNSDLDNLNQTLEGQKNILQSLENGENEFRQVQARMDTADAMINTQLGGVSLVRRVVEKIPAEVKLSSVRADDKGVTLQATTVSEEALGSMLAGLASDKNWTDVKLTDLATDNGTIIKFSLELDK